MATDNVSNTSDSELCVVCYKKVEIYSIGICDHAVCFECSTRMRILCKQNECPICRRELPKVIFTKNIEPYSIIYPRYERSNLQEAKFGILFCTTEIQKAYQKLLEHKCHICERNGQNWSFKSFVQLRDHMRREHEMFYCDICSEHLKIFSFERKCYTRAELGYHRRKGDKNNTSHRGHPLCEFCDMRFMDSDDLFRHLRRNHLFCHFCDADGKNQYYNCMDELIRHFKAEHFLCEEGECKSVPLAAVFRTDIDLKAHITTEHSRFMSKSANRQARTLELEFHMTPRPRSDNVRTKRNNERRDRYETDNFYSYEPGGAEGGGLGGPQPQVFVNPLTSDQFPALGGSSGGNSNITLVTNKNYTKFSSGAFNSNDFPSLGGSNSRPSPAVTIRANSATGSSAPEVTITRTVRNPQPTQTQKENFPALGGGSSKSSGSSTVRLSVNASNSSNSQQPPPKVSIKVNQKSNGAISTHITASTSSQSRTTEAFPSLGKSKQPIVPTAQWRVQHKNKKPDEQKANKVAPCPVLEPSDINSFPSLSKTKNDKVKKTSSVTVPVDSWVNLNTMNSNLKNGKKSDQNLVENGAQSSNGNIKGSGDSSSDKKKTDSTNKKSNSNKGPSEKSLADGRSKLDAKLENLTFVEYKKPDEGTKTDDNNKKSKKKKDKTIAETKTEEPTKNEIKEDNNKNGMTKKRSELKIGSLINSNNNNDFPSLGGTKPPPGFTSKPASVKPPPGFNNSSFPPLSFSNDLTFTNSSGQSYAISPTSSHAYKQPLNFQNRNQNLIKSFMEVLNNNDSIKEFKSLSDKFRKGEIKAKQYYDHCKKILNNKLDDLLPELLVLLPDIDKQQELYQQISGKCKEKLLICENCGQIIFKWELSEHYNHHRLENHFPSLGSAQQIDSAWKK
ncbi:E3 ubiquitin-protein ligase ZNF598 isoform X2 [Anthonomus grandis grandis]|uniref:E3 ubiquitin-protein ligase ZNF598 isoform X2 n=1 Tax=Anthonomus grandis grandis TaxID=2921223 RepID=UPI0021653FEC|nr:E3 ubiquitin-protein ligase ZNF598 isoform X2 [Anthonomus grandis grandis]